MKRKPSILKILLLIVWIYISIKLIPWFGIGGFVFLIPAVVYKIALVFENRKSEKNIKEANEKIAGKPNGISTEKENETAKGKAREKKIKRKTDVKNITLSDYQLERFMIECNAQLEHDEQMRQYEEYYDVQKEKAETKPKYQKADVSSVDIDEYAKMCNAYIEHEEEMKSYKEYYNTKDDDSDDK